MAKHYSTAAIHWEICPLYEPVYYGTKVMSYEKNSSAIWFVHFESSQTNLCIPKKQKSNLRLLS